MRRADASRALSANLMQERLMACLSADAINNISFLASNDAFLGAISEFIKQSLEFQKLIAPTQEYQRILQDELRKKEAEPDYQLDEQLINQAKKALISLEIPQTNHEQIVKDFPGELKKFTAIFAELVKKDTVLVNNHIKEISKAFGLDQQLLKEWFELQSPEINKSPQQQLSVPRLNEVINNLPPLIKPKAADKQIKSIDDILTELQLGDDKDVDSHKNADLIIKAKLKKDYDDILRADAQWNSKNAHAINKWLVDNKGKLSAANSFEVIAILNRVNELATGGQRLRVPQILSLLLFIDEHGQGKICQIMMGEGKTTIVALFAALKIILGAPQVDIITSNQIVAADGMKETNVFFDLLGITVAHNADATSEHGVKHCYSAQVLYADIATSQFDFLSGARGARAFSMVILDEIDAMLIDNGQHAAKLSTPFPGLESLRYVYIKIWQELIKAEAELTEEIRQKLSESSKSMDAMDFNAAYVDVFYEKIKEKIRTSAPTTLDLIPEHLKDYAAKQLESWINNALNAKYQYQENQQYIISKNADGEDCVLPVDNINTGVTLHNTVWEQGLHQFLQLKHNLHLTAETLTNSFISNIGYIKRYQNNIYGLTGTIGSVAEQEFLFAIYNINFAKMPTYKQRNFLELPGLIVEDEECYKTVALRSIDEIEAGRATLILFGTIAELLEVKKNILCLKETTDKPLQIKEYYLDEHTSVPNEVLNSGDIVLATNLGGRGTNFKTSMQVEQHGGLTLLFADLPYNQRVEDQGFGRTFRQGNKGRAQLIIKRSAALIFVVNDDLTLENVKKNRDIQEQARLHDIQTNQIWELNLRDELYQEFFKFYQKLKRKPSGQDGINYRYLLKDFKEFWAFWLLKQEFQREDRAPELFKAFEKSAQPLLDGKTIHNPYYRIQQAEAQLADNESAKARMALADIRQLACDPSLAVAIQIKQFEIAINEGQALWQRIGQTLAKTLGVGYFLDVKNQNYKSDALEHLTKADNHLQTEISYIKQHFIINDGSAVNLSVAEKKRLLLPAANNYFLVHIKSRLTALELALLNLQSLKEQIKDSKLADGLVIQSSIPNYWSNLVPSTDDEKKIKALLKTPELIELEHVGLSGTYELKKITDAKETVIAAQVQISTGLSVLAGGMSFPPSLPVVAPIANILISEGICDLLLELLSNGKTDFSAAAFAKGKAISYGISLLTLGVSSLLTCEKILKNALAVCRSLTELLKTSPILKAVCEKLILVIEQLALHMNAVAQAGMEAKALAATLSVSALRTHAITTIGKNIAQSVAFTLVCEKVVAANIEEGLMACAPLIKKSIQANLEKKLDKERLASLSPEQFTQLLSAVLDESMGGAIFDVAKEISLGTLRESNNFKLKLISLSLDSLIVGTQLAICISNFCGHLNREMSKFTGKEGTAEVSNQRREYLAQVLTDKINGHLAGLLGKWVVTGGIELAHGIIKQLTVNTAESSVSLQQSLNDKELNTMAHAYELLGLKPGCSEQEFKQQMRKLYLDNHPDRHPGDVDAKRRMQNINAAHDMIKKRVPPPMEAAAPMAAKPSAESLVVPPQQKLTPTQPNQALPIGIVPLKPAAKLALLPGNHEENSCLHQNMATHLLGGVDVDKLALNTGVFASLKGSTIADSLIMLDRLGFNIEVMFHAPQDSPAQLTQFMSANKTDKLLAFTIYKNNDHALGHVVVIENHANGLLVKDAASSQSLAEHIRSNNILNFTLVAVHDLNAALARVQEQISNTQPPLAAKVTVTGASASSQGLFGVKILPEKKFQEASRRAMSKMRLSSSQKMLKHTLLTSSSAEKTIISIKPAIISKVPFHAFLEACAVHLEAAALAHKRAVTLRFADIDFVISKGFMSTANQVVIRGERATAYHQLKIFHVDVANISHMRNAVKIMNELIKKPLNEVMHYLNDIENKDTRKEILDFLVITHIAENYRPAESGELTLNDVTKPFRQKDAEAGCLSRTPGSSKLTRGFLSYLSQRLATDEATIAFFKDIKSSLDALPARKDVPASHRLLELYLEFAADGGTNQQRLRALEHEAIFAPTPEQRQAYDNQSKVSNLDINENEALHCMEVCQHDASPQNEPAFFKPGSAKKAGGAKKEKAERRAPKN